MLLREELSRPEMRLLNRHAVDHRIGTREINILEQTQRVRLLPAVRAYRAHPLGAEHHYLARLDIADKLRADRRQRAALGRHDIASVRADADSGSIPRGSRSAISFIGDMIISE